MKKIIFTLVIILIISFASCASNIVIPEEPEEKYTEYEYLQYQNGRLNAPAGYFSGFCNHTYKFEATGFFHPKTGEYQGDVIVSTTFDFDGEVAFIGAWYGKSYVVSEGCEISAVVTRVEGRFDKLKVVATCIAPEAEGSSQLVYYLTATGTGNLIRSSE